MYIISNIGVSGGAHRLWSHKSYKAKLPLRILLLICFSASVQVMSIICYFTYIIYKVQVYV